MKLTIRRIFILLLSGLGLNACTDDYFEFDKISVEDWRPQVAFPVINSTLSLEDIIIRNDTGEIIQTDPNTGILEVIYNGSVFSSVGGQFIDLADQTFNENVSGIVIPPGSPNITVNRNLTTNFTTTVEVDSILLKGGSLVFTMESDFQHNIDVQIDFPGIRDANGQALKINETLPASNGINPTVRSSINDLNGKLIDMTNNGTTINTIPINVALTIRPVAGNPSSTNDELRLIGNIRSMNFKEFSGYIGSESIDLDIDTIGINLFKNFKSGNFFISNPTLEIDIKNSYALPANLQFQTLDARNVDKSPQILSVDLPLDPTTNSQSIRALQSPVKYGIAVTNLPLDTINSNIDDILSFFLKEIIYDSKAEFNPNGKTSQRNFLTDTSGIGLDVFLKIPFEGRASDFMLVDTIDFDFNIADDIDNGNIRVIADNGFPIDVALQLVFADSAYNSIDSLYEAGMTSTIPASPIDGNGDAVGSTRSITDAFVDNRRFSKLGKSKYAIIKASLNTQNANQNQNIRFREGYKMQISVGLQAGILIK